MPASYPVRNRGGKSDTSLRALHHPSPSRRGLNERRRRSHRNDSSPRGRERLNRSEEHTSELQSRGHLVCRLLLEKKKNMNIISLLQKQDTGEDENVV